ncbi:MAG: AAA family ATPase, partial [Polyangiaceae bacterium]
MPATAWLVRDLQLAPGRPALLCGSAGAGKTIIAQSLALFVAAGLPAWGQFPARSGRVLHIDYDQGEPATRKRYRRLAAGHGIDYLSLGERLRLMPFPPVYLNAREKAEAFLVAHCADTALCVIDALRGALPGTDENDSRIGAHVNVCSRVSDQTGTTFIILHHLGKPKDGGEDAPTSPRGSSAIIAGAGAVLLVTGAKDSPK